MRSSSDTTQGVNTAGQEELLQVLTDSSATYFCPGESMPVSSAVHQARLRAHYRKCRECPHREDSALLSADAREQLLSWWQQKSKSQARLEEGFRGVYLNEMTLQDVEQVAAGVCHWLWKQSLSAVSHGKSYRASLVMGHDSRVMSLEVVQKAIRAVREQGANVIDVGEVSGPCLQFAVEQLKADAGLHATSAGEEATVIGLDVYGPEGFPLSGESLHTLQEEFGARGAGRCGRTAGEVVPFPARKAYLANLWKYYRGLPALNVIVFSCSDFVLRLLQDLQQELAVKLVPCFETELIGSGPKTLRVEKRIEQQILHHASDLGVVLGEDGRSCEFYDRSGRVLSSAMVLQKILRSQCSSSAEPPVLMLGEEFQADELWLSKLSAEELQITRRYRQSLRENFARGMKTAKAQLGLDHHHRYWLPGPVPVCDGLATLGVVLQALAEDLLRERHQSGV